MSAFYTFTSASAQNGIAELHRRLANVLGLLAKAAIAVAHLHARKGAIQAQRDAWREEAEYLAA
ncbi:hypothetical protein ACLBX9_18745 [Methylobacterium sp. A49B]